MSKVLGSICLMLTSAVWEMIFFGVNLPEGVTLP